MTCVNRELIGTHGRTIEWAHPQPYTYPQTVGLQIADHGLSTSCGVVERPDHHCGDDLVIMWRGGAIYSGLDSQPDGPGFKSRS